MKTIDLNSEDLEKKLLPEDTEVALVGEVTLKHAEIINQHVFDMLDLSNAIFGIEQEVNPYPDPFGGSEYIDVDVMLHVINNCNAAKVVLPDYVEGVNIDGMIVCSKSAEEKYQICSECGRIYKGNYWPAVCPVCEEEHRIYAAEKWVPEGWSPKENDVPVADEYPHSSMGERVRDFFTSKFKNSSKFVDKLFLKCLPALKVDEGYRIVPVNNDGGLGSHYTLEAINEKGKVRQVLAHITAEYSVQGVWQAVLLSFATAWMPVFWHGAYLAYNYIFSEKDLEKCNKDAYMKFKDEDVYPHVVLNGNVATVTYCYWTGSRGLIKKTELFGLDEQGHLFHMHDDRNSEKLIYEYHSGICF